MSNEISNENMRPLAVHFIWHPSAEEKASSTIKRLNEVLFKSDLKSFSRCIDIPFFYYSSENESDKPREVECKYAKSNLIFAFIDDKLVHNSEWKEYVKNLDKDIDKKKYLIQIFLNREVIKNAPLEGRNGIRFETLNFSINKLVLSMLNEIYRAVVGKDEPTGDKSSLKLFLSHTKADDFAIKIVEDLRNYITNTNMSFFFDVWSIQPGYIVKDEIENHLSDATLLAIETDTYSSRYWCQKEVVLAKQKQRPMLIVNAISKAVDRVFPALSNAPCIRINPNEDELSKYKIQEILEATLVESIRVEYSKKILDYYKENNWIEDNDCKTCPVPPDIYSFAESKNQPVHKSVKVCYPEPAIQYDEWCQLKKFGIDAFTPLLKLDDQKTALQNMKVGISISLGNEFAYNTNYRIDEKRIVRLSGELVRNLYVRGASVIYGGDFRENSLTETMLEEIYALYHQLHKDKNEPPDCVIYNYLAGIIEVPKKIDDLRVNYEKIFEIIPTGSTPKKENNPIDSQISWSKSLTEMRERIVKESDARILAGGKLCGYKGKMPGVLEEFWLSYKANKPIYLMGGFGGCVHEICRLIGIDGVDKDSRYLQSDWQEDYNLGYKSVQGKLGNPKFIDLLADEIKKIDIQDLANKANLSLEEYKKLMISPFSDECFYLINKGLKKIKKK